MFNINTVKDIFVGEQSIGKAYLGSRPIFNNVKLPILDDLVLWYDFKNQANSDENREIAVDLSGNGNDGNLLNFNYTEQSGYFDNGLQFDGIDDRLNVTHNNIVLGVEGFTMSSTLLFEPVSKPEAIFSGRSLNGGRTGDFRIEKRSDTQINAKIDGYLQLIAFANGTLTSPLVINLTVVVKQRDAIADAYINGVYTSSRDLRSPLHDVLLQDIGSTAGRAAWDSTYSKINIKSAMVYTRALDAEEIEHNYNIEKSHFGLGGSV